MEIGTEPFFRSLRRNVGFYFLIQLWRQAFAGLFFSASATAAWRFVFRPRVAESAIRSGARELFFPLLLLAQRLSKRPLCGPLIASVLPSEPVRDCLSAGLESASLGRFTSESPFGACFCLRALYRRATLFSAVAVHCGGFLTLISCFSPSNRGSTTEFSASFAWRPQAAAFHRLQKSRCFLDA